MNTRRRSLFHNAVVAAFLTGATLAVFPFFDEYKVRGLEARAESDLRNAATAEEAYFVAAETYVSCVNEECTRLLPGFRLTDGIYLEMKGSATNFSGESAISEDLYDNRYGRFTQALTCETGSCWLVRGLGLWVAWMTPGGLALSLQWLSRLGRHRLPGAPQPHA